MKESDDQSNGTTQDDMINYMPGMPPVTGQSSGIERFLKRVGARRGKLRRVVQHRDDTVARTDDTVFRADD